MGLFKSKITQGALTGACAALIAGGLYLGGLLEWVEAPLWKWRQMAFAAPSDATDQIRLILLDQSSLDWAAKENQASWPWPREYYAAVLDFLNRAGAKAVVFDMLFTETSRTGVDDDELFAGAIRKTKGFVAAVACSKKQGETTRWPAEAVTSITARFSDPAPPCLSVLSMPFAAFPARRLAAPSSFFGSILAEPDPDGVIRAVPAFHCFDKRFIPSLGLAAYLAGHPDARLYAAPPGLAVDGRLIPLDARGNAVLRFRGPAQTHRAESAARVIQSELRLREGGKPPVAPEEFKDKYVFFGVTAPGLLDLKSTPLSPVYPGVEIHATFLDNLLARKAGQGFPRKAPAGTVLGLSLLLAVLAGVAARRWDGIRGTLLVALAGLPAPLLLGFAAYEAGGWLHIAAPLTAVALAQVGALGLNYAVEGRQKRFIKGAFRQYLSPAVIDLLVKNPGRLRLGGELRELSIYFSDVQGFTSISETLSPVELTALLNDYLTAMTDIIMEEGGTVDKYEGDAVIAFWNAPLDLPDHAGHAARAALRCQKKIDELRPAFEKRIAGRPFRARIGLNSGMVVVGNMGSSQRFDYTFLGDAGNLASRLEGVNKQFGTSILISEATRNLLGGEFAAREISRIQVVGKNEPVRVYEPYFREDFAARADLLHAFERALALYYAGRFAEALEGFAAIESEDPPAAAYARRCRELAAAPPENWQGVWKMTEK